MWTKKQKRAYHRAKSGIKVSTILRLPIKHMVLTTSPQAINRNISNDFQALRKSVYRQFGFLLAYFMVHTNEGNGVLHVIFRAKQYIPQRWLSQRWEKYHQSSYVYIKEVPDDDIARYIVTQYVADQGTTYQRCSWSHSWVARGFVKQWHHYLRWYNQYKAKLNLTFEDLLTKWDKWLMSQVIKQATLF